MILILISTTANAQLPTLEMAPGDGNPTGNGQILSTQIRLRNSTNNPSGTTISIFTPALNATYTLKNFEYNNYYETTQLSTRQNVNIG